MPKVNFTPSNPNTTTRERFTDNILAIEIPSNASSWWSDSVRHQKGLYKALYDHSAMEPNRQQTFMTKAAQKSRAYHLWDFVGRTLQYLYMVDYTKDLNQYRGQEKQIAEDAAGRVGMSKMLVNDASGKADMMVNANIDINVEWGDEVTRAAGPM